MRFSNSIIDSKIPSLLTVLKTLLFKEPSSISISSLLILLTDISYKFCSEQFEQFIFCLNSKFLGFLSDGVKYSSISKSCNESLVEILLIFF